MHFFITVKQVGKKRNYLTDKAFELDATPNILQDLIIGIVKKNVQTFNDKVDNDKIFEFLSQSEVESLAEETGKVGFNSIYNDKKADENKAIENALICFKDGIYRVFIDETEIQNLEDHITLTENSKVIFIKLVMLAGRMW
jgi:hypothetical protein